VYIFFNYFNKKKKFNFKKFIKNNKNNNLHFFFFFKKKKTKHLKYLNLQKKVYKYNLNTRFILKSFLFLKKKKKSIVVKIAKIQKIFQKSGFNFLFFNKIYLLLKNKIALNLNDACFFLKKKFFFIEKSLIKEKSVTFMFEILYSSLVYFYLLKIRKKLFTIRYKFRKKKKKYLNKKKNLKYFFYLFVFNYYEFNSFFSFLFFDLYTMTFFFLCKKIKKKMFEERLKLLHKYFFNSYLWKLM
jgi:hypothetical protein